MSGSKSRDKGQRFERSVCKAFRDTFGGEWRRTQGGENQAIVGDVRPLEWPSFPFTIECKSTKDTFLDQLLSLTGPVQSWWDQTEKQTPKEKLPLLVCKWDRHSPYAIVNRLGLIYINAHFDNPEVFIKFIYKRRELYLLLFDEFLERLKLEEIRKNESSDLYNLAARTSLT